MSEQQTDRKKKKNEGGEAARLKNATKCPLCGHLTPPPSQLAQAIEDGLKRWRSEPLLGAAGEAPEPSSVQSPLKHDVKRLIAALFAVTACGKMTSDELHLSAKLLQQYAGLRSHRYPRPLANLAMRVRLSVAELEGRMTVEESQIPDGIPDHALELLELPEKRLFAVLEKWNVVSAMLRGSSVRDALALSHVERSRSWARRAYTRYSNEGVLGLLDRRRNNGSEPTVLTPEVIEELKELMYRFPEWTVKALHSELSQSLIAQGLAAPSYETVRCWLANLPPQLQLSRELVFGPSDEHRLVRCQPHDPLGRDGEERLARRGRLAAGRRSVGVAPRTTDP